MSRELLVFGDKTFKITIPDDAKVTFGPFSPPTMHRENWASSGRAAGTLRIYGRSKEDVLGVFSNVTGFRDVSLGYMEEIAVEEGAKIWKSDENGYVREEKVSAQTRWVEPVAALPNPKSTKKK